MTRKKADREVGIVQCKMILKREGIEFAWQSRAERYVFAQQLPLAQEYARQGKKLSTLRGAPCGTPRITRGRDGSLLLSRMTLQRRDEPQLFGELAPVTDIVSRAPEPSVTVNAPVNAPYATGLNVTVMEHAAPTARLTPQLFL